MLCVMLLLMLMLFALNSQAWAATNKAAFPKVGYRAPDFTVRDLAGNDVTLGDQLGKPVFINFFATWCTFCRVEMPYIEALYEELGGEVAFMIIDLRENQDVVEAFFQDHGLTVPVYLDGAGTSGTRYAVRGIPASFFVDADGIIREMAIGALTEERLRQGLAKILP